MSDRAIVATAIVVVVAALWSHPVPAVAVGASVVVAGGTRGRPVVVVLVAAGLAASLLGARARDGLVPSMAPGHRVHAVATLVTDPESAAFGVRTDVRVQGRRWRLTASEGAAMKLRHAAAGHRYRIDATYRPLDPLTASRTRARHLAGRLDVTSTTDVVFVDGGAVLARFANAVREVLVRGVGHLSPDQRALFTGVVLGDDRAQDPAEVEDFRAGGLTHLLAVSGQNVAFLFALAAPVLQRIRPVPRLATAGCVLVVFGTVTRWEPSVTRATAMAGVTLLATHTGRPLASVRTLATAVTALVLVDPLLVHSIGFALSTAACAGLAVFGPRLAAHLPLAISATLAAQAGVLPMLLGWFGPVPLASVPANVLAGPVAGPLMMWGVAAGLPAGVVGGPVARLLHLPTQVLLLWLAQVARLSAGVPLAWITPRGALVAAIVGGLGAIAVRRRPPLVRPATIVAAGVTAAFALSPGLAPADHDGLRLETYGRDVLWRRGAAVVVVSDGGGSPGPLVNALRREGVTAVDVLVMTRGSKRSAVVVQPLFERIAVGTTFAPANHQIARAISVERPIVVLAGDLRIAIEPDGKALDVRIGSP